MLNNNKIHIILRDAEIRRISLFLSIMALVSAWFAPRAKSAEIKLTNVENFDSVLSLDVDSLRRGLVLDTVSFANISRYDSKGNLPTIYEMPYSVSGSCHDWKRLWINTGVLSGAFVGTLAVLECLPEDATSWNRAELQDVPLGRRWKNHVIEKGPEWDHDHFVFNYILHPYAGAAYFMAARSCGFNMWQSALYCTLVSNVGWEFGIEAFMERPSIQDLFITPIVGSAIGEGFYRLKRRIVDDDYYLFGSRVLGNIVAFFIDPVNEVVGLFSGNPARQLAERRTSKFSVSVSPTFSPRMCGFSLVAVF